MSLEQFVRRPRAETKLHPRRLVPAPFQTLPVSVCMYLCVSHHSNYKYRLSVSLSNNLFMCLCASSAKSLQEFAAVLQNLEDERTRMVSDQEVVINIIDGGKLIYFSFCEYQPSEMCQCAHMWWRECSLVSWLKFNHLDCKNIYESFSAAASDRSIISGLN